MTGRHALDGQRRAALAARLNRAAAWLRAAARDTWTRARRALLLLLPPVTVIVPAACLPAPGAAPGQARTLTQPNPMLPAPVLPLPGQAQDPAATPSRQPEGAAIPARPAPSPSTHGEGAAPLSAPVPPTAGHGQRWEDITVPLAHPLMVATAAEWRRHDAIIAVGPDTGGITRTRIYTATGLRRTQAQDAIDDGIAVARPYALAAEWARRHAGMVAA